MPVSQNCLHLFFLLLKLSFLNSKNNSKRNSDESEKSTPNTRSSWFKFKKTAPDNTPAVSTRAVSTSTSSLSSDLPTPCHKDELKLTSNENTPRNTPIEINRGEHNRGPRQNMHFIMELLARLVSRQRPQR